MNVDCPDARSSDAPMRVNSLSTMPTRAALAGTKLPICAISTISATCRMYVDLPAMFGPVMIATRPPSGLRFVSFGTKRESFNTCSTTGCRPAVICTSPERSISGLQ